MNGNRPEKTMKCPYLEKWVLSTCRADEDPYTPSVFQLHEYCKSSDHRKCPFYLRDVVRGAAAEGLIYA